MTDLKRQSDTFIACDCPYKTADIVLWGAPFDSTTSNRPGARFGAKAIREESYGLETYSPYLDKDLADYNIFDAGDLELPFGDLKRTKNAVFSRTKKILNDNKIPFMLGGEHSLTLGAVEAAHQKYGGLHLIHFDAHTDLRDDYLGVKYSHASVIRRCHEILGDNKIFQFGIRSGERAEFQWAKEHTALTKFNFDGLSGVTHNLKKSAVPVYFTLDLDVLDPSFFSGTGTPEPCGVSICELMDAINLVSTLNIVGCDVMELAPNLDSSGVSSAVAAKVVREMLLNISDKKFGGK